MLGLSLRFDESHRWHGCGLVDTDLDAVPELFGTRLTASGEDDTTAALVSKHANPWSACTSTLTAAERVIRSVCHFFHVFGDRFVCQCAELRTAPGKCGRDCATALCLKLWAPRLCSVYHTLSWLSEDGLYTVPLASLAACAICQLPVQYFFRYSTVRHTVYVATPTQLQPHENRLDTWDFAPFKNIRNWDFVLPLHV